MRYLVITAQGTYGPVDSVELSRWAAEGRLSPTTVIEIADTGERISASQVPGLGFRTFQHAPAADGSMIALGRPTGSHPAQPVPPAIVSNYRRPDWEPPLFLPDPTQGKRELQYAFLLALAGPIGATFITYAVLLPLGGVYGGYIAWRRGRVLGVPAMVLSVLSLIASIAIRIYTGLRFG